MSKTRRIKSDTAQAMVNAMVNAALPDLQPPEHVTLSEQGKRFWLGVVRARARDEWDELDLVVAAQLAECQALIEQESATLRTEGMVIANDRGTLVENPRNRVVQTLAQREMALMRSLRMGGKPAGEVHHQIKARAVQKQAQRARESLADDELLAT
jgi:hypothetical protein